MKAWKPDNPPEVLRRKFEEAQDLVAWYEEKLQKLRLVLQSAVIKNLKSEELRIEIEAALEAIYSRGHTTSLIREDCENITRVQLGKGILRRLKEASDSCRKGWARLDKVSHKDPGSRDESLAIVNAIRTSCDVLELGLEPVRIARDAYVTALGRKPKVGRGRKKSKSKPLRDKEIAKRFWEMPGKPAERKRILAQEYDLSSDYIGRIANELNPRKPGKKG